MPGLETPPFRRVQFWKPVRYSVHARVHAIVRPARRGPDTSLFTLPVRRPSRSGGAASNAVLAFLCRSQAQLYCRALNGGRGTATAACLVCEFEHAALASMACELRVPLAVVGNSFCEGSQREPFFELMLSTPHDWSA